MQNYIKHTNIPVVFKQQKCYTILHNWRYKLKTIIKWPGGKSKEFDKIQDLIPKHTRYIEPFFGGGAVFFKLKPKKAIINDISKPLTLFYTLIKDQDQELKKILLKYDKSFQSLLYTSNKYYSKILESYYNNNAKQTFNLVSFILSNSLSYTDLILDFNQYHNTISKTVINRFKRTHKNNIKLQFSNNDLKENLITGFTGGFYMYFRNVYNDINLNKIKVNDAYNIANFYFIREYCYGSMFRYNKYGEFNIPYGGISYNNKQFEKKINLLFNSDIKEIFKNTKIYNLDFEDFFNQINLEKNDFIFLDPPYDTDFSKYEGKDFTLKDQERLRNNLLKIPSKFILIIKNTEYIYKLYKSNFKIIPFEKKYTYNIRGRNNKKVTHLIVTNF